MDAAGSIESTTTAAAVAAATATGSINITPLLALPEACTATSTPSLISLPDDCAATVASFLRTQEIGVLIGTGHAAAAQYCPYIATVAFQCKNWDGDQQRLLSTLSSLMCKLPRLTRVAAPSDSWPAIPNMLDGCLTAHSFRFSYYELWRIGRR